MEMVIGGDPDCHRRRLKTKLIAMGIDRYDRVLVEPSGVFDVDEFLDLLYEEPLDDDVIRSAIHYIRNADVLIVGGTSLMVYPAAGLINYYRGHKLVSITRSSTPTEADLVVHGKIGEVFGQV